MGKLFRYLKDNWWNTVQGDARWHVLTEVKRYFFGTWGVWHVLTFLTSIAAGTWGAFQAWIHSQPGYIVTLVFLVAFAVALAIANFSLMLWDRWRQRLRDKNPPGKLSRNEERASQFEIEYLGQELLWRTEGELDFHLILSGYPMAKDAILGLRVTAKITAIPAHYINDVQLEVEAGG